MGWVQPYLKVNVKDSETRNIGIGVPQGSCLGLILFLLYINDLPFSLKYSQATMVADDTSVSFPANNIDDLITTINIDLVCLEEWLCGNKVSLNVVKSQAMVIGSKHKLGRCNHPKVTEISMKINTGAIKSVSCTKYLGVQIDDNLALG